MKTITATKNFWDAFFLKISHRRNTIVFRNGIKAEVNWTEFCALRDGFDDLRDASLVIKKAEEGYHVQKVHTQLIHTAASLKDAQNFSKFILSIFSHGWNVEQVNDKSFTAKKENVSYDIHKLEDGLLEITSDKFKMIGPPDAAAVFFTECDLYKCDYANKVVLDVGGYCGETAVFFSSQGAKKVVIYEPVLVHHKFIKKNIALNNIQAELHDEGIGKENGTETIHYSSINQEFGRFNEGKKELIVKVKNVAEVIADSLANVGKFDCEGAEVCLVDVPEEILRKIDFYIIETHTREIQKKIENKFAKAGFRMARAPVDVAKGVSVLCFEKAKSIV